MKKADKELSIWVDLRSRQPLAVGSPKVTRQEHEGDSCPKWPIPIRVHLALGTTHATLAGAFASAPICIAADHLEL